MELDAKELQALAVCADPDMDVARADPVGVQGIRSRGMINHRREVTGKGLCAVALYDLAPAGNLSRVRRGRPDRAILGGRRWHGVKIIL